jgi:hypothetical protein
MSNEALIHLVLTAVGWVAGIATMRAQLAGATKRLDDMDQCMDKLDERFVPRRELEAKLDALQKSVDRIADTVSLAISARINRGFNRNNPDRDQE